MKFKSESKKSGLLLVLLSCFFVYFVIWAFTGEWPWHENPYNSYVLQAKAWLGGHMDLGRDYSHLEIACFGGKYYVSFPPVPSVILLPFVLAGISDGFVALGVSLLSAAYVWRLCRKCGIENSEFWTLFLVLGSNILLVSVNAWVWFFAQNVSFLFTVMSIYYALSKKGTLSLALWALAVGCRPFQIVYLPLLIVILYESKDEFRISAFAKQLIIPLCIAAMYMIYNYMRFGSVCEFGHNYLPEFLEAEKGQFNIAYIPENLKTLIRLPSVGEESLIFPKFNGMSIFLCFPIVIFCLGYAIGKIKNPRVWIGLCLAVFQILLITAHKTMGGYHFGNRYFIDVMPILFYIMLISMPKKKDLSYCLASPLFLFGMGLNIVGIINMFVNA